MKPADIYRRTGGVYSRIYSQFPGNDNHDDTPDKDALHYFSGTAHHNTTCEEWPAQQQTWPARYHFSVQRSNILRPFVDFFPQRNILEIGCGCGSLTQLLGEHKARVIALEDNFRYATIAAERCIDWPDVMVVNDNFDRFECNEQFDVIIAANGLEYSNRLMAGGQPVRQLIEKATALLQPNGIIILAIDNALGLKYWAGAPDHCSGQVYNGIENRHHPGAAITLGKEEIKGILREAGLTQHAFYYPFPDYKFANVILTEKSLNIPGFSIPDLLLSNLDYVQNRLYYPSFSLELAVQQIVNNQLTGQLANSFIVVAGRNEQVFTQEEILAWSYSARRKKGYRKENRFCLKGEQQIIVEKRKMYPEELPEPNPFIQQHLQNETYVQGHLYFLRFMEIMSTPHWSVNDLVQWALPYYKLLLSLSHRHGNELYLDGRYADLTPFNILIDHNGGLQVFDQEWEVNEQVPLAYVLFRGLYYCLAKPVSVYPPAPGTPLYAFTLVPKIIESFFALPGHLVTDFIEREHNYFRHVSLYSSCMPADFELHGMQKQAVAPFTIQANLFRQRDGLPEENAGEYIFTLPGTARIEAGSHCTIALKLSDVDAGKNEALVNVQQLITDLVNNCTAPLEAELVNKNHEINLLEEQLARQDKEIDNLQKSAVAYNQVQEDNTRLQRYIEWYKRTYETRSLPGILKDRCTQFIQKTYKGLLRRLMETRFIRRRYAAAWLLGYAGDKGLRAFCKAAIREINTHGLNSVIHCKKIVRSQLHRRPAAQAIAVTRQPAPVDRQRLKREMATWHSLPKISVICPVYNTPPSLLQAAIRSVRDQIYENWELCIADDASTQLATKIMLSSFENDPRIHIQWLEKNEGISEASNKAIELSTGDFIALLDHDDELTPDALYWVAKEINTHSEVDIIYTDECKINEQGELSDFFYKPGWSPELLFNMMYPGHLTVYRKALLQQEVGYFRKAFDFSQDYDLMLRATEKTDHIRHIPRVLYYWRLTEGSAAQGDKPYARQTNLAALHDAMQRRGMAADIIELPAANRVQLQWDLNTKVSVIIPTDSLNNLTAAIESITGITTYPDYEVIVVTNSGLISAMNNRFTLPQVKYVAYDRPYNFSDKCNYGAEQANGEILIFFNDDVRPLQRDWIEHTIEYISLPGIGGVSPKLVYENDTLQFAGMASGVRNLVGTTFHCWHKDAVQYFNFPQLVRNISILSGACLAIRRSLFIELGGFDHINTPSAHSDVDLSFKILQKGLRCLYTPYATLRHIGHLSLQEHEQKQEKTKKDKADIFLLRHWVKYLGEDLYFPRSMRNLLYHDSPEPFTLQVPDVHIQFGNKGDVLLVAHELSFSGAPIILFNIARLLVANGYFVVVYSAHGGPLQQRFAQEGITTIIDELVFAQHDSFYRFAKNFDWLIANTVIAWPVVQQMQAAVTTIWWIHEAALLPSLTVNYDFVKTLRLAQHVIGVSDYALQYIKKYNRNVTKIYNGIKDVAQDMAPQEGNGEIQKDTLVYSIMGSIEPRKGQDILLEALDYIEESLLQRMEIQIIGRTLDNNFKAMLQEKARHRTRVRFINEVSHEQCMEYMAASDVVISASRDEPYSLVIAEALCMGKTCIVSDRTGIVELIKEGGNGFVFTSGDARDLAGKISFIAQHPGICHHMKAAARDTYDHYLALHLFEQKILNYLNHIHETVPAARQKRKTILTTPISEQ